MAKDGSEFAIVGLEGWEIAGEYRRLWPDRELAESQVLRIQIKLHQWAIDDPDRRFDDLFNLVCDPAVLVVAWARVRGNRGKRSAGVDGLRPQSILSAEEEFLPQLRDDLKARLFTPLPVRERMIPPSRAAASCDGWASRPRGIAPCKRPSSWCSSRSSRRTSSHARMASVPDGEPRTRSRRFTSSPPAPMSGCWKVTSKRVWMHHHTAPPANCVDQNRPSWGFGDWMRRPFLRPVRTCTAWSSPRLTRCNRVWRDMP